MKSRIYSLDNLRTFLIFLVVVLHSGLVYEAALETLWIVVDPDKANNLGLLRMYLDVFVMFTLFYISGYFVLPSIHKKSTGKFISDKAKRLMFPWLVGVLTMIPAYKYIFLYSRGLPQEEWFTYFHIFQRSYGNPFFFADNPVQNWLWFLPILFSFQLIYLLMCKMGISLRNISIKYGVLFTLVIGLIYSVIMSQSNLTGWHHSAIFHFQRERLIPYFLIFLLGVVSYHQQIFTPSGMSKKLYIWTNIVLTPILAVFTVAALNLFFNMIDPERNFYFISDTWDVVGYHLFLLISMLGFLYLLIYTFHQYFNTSGKWSKILNANSYYVYIIHLVVIGVIALPLLAFDFSPVLKFFILTLSAYIVSNILVYIFMRYLEKPLSKQWIRILFILLAAIVYYQVWEHKDSEVKENNIHNILDHPPIHEAAMTGNLASIQYYIDQGVDLNAKDELGGSSPLIIAAMFGQREVVEALLSAEVDIELKNNDGSNALHTATFFGRTDIVKLLLDSGADMTIKNNSGSTALQIVTVPFDQVRGIYDYFVTTFGPSGLQLDYEELQQNRKDIEGILSR